MSTEDEMTGIDFAGFYGLDEEPGVGRSASSSPRAAAAVGRDGAMTMQAGQSPVTNHSQGVGREAESEPARRPKAVAPKYVSVSVHMPEEAAEELKQLARIHGLAFKHLTSVALAAGVSRLRRMLAFAGCNEDEDQGSIFEAI
jgi:hypothetical protein